MRQIIGFIFAICCWAFQTLEAQIDTLQLLPEVVLSDVQLHHYSKGIFSATIPDSLIKNDITLLTNQLRDNSFIYFRENGPGGVSSASFRGTNAQQTAVIWNGININSQLTGQTDFNTIGTYNYDRVSIRSGGGSIPYGSGAVGGSIHLENTMRFKKRFKNEVVGGYASFDSHMAHAKSIYATENFHIDIAGDYLASENDFEYLGTNQSNENGELEMSTVAMNVGYKFSKDNDRPQHLIKLHHTSFFGDRNFSGTLIAPSDDGYQDRNAKSLVSWQHLGNRYEGRLNVAHIYEQFRYFPSTNRSVYSIGKAIRYVGSYDAMYRLDSSKSIKGIITADHIAGSGSSIASVDRQLFSVVVHYDHQLSDQFTYGIQLRQELTDLYNNPFLIGVGGEYAFAKAKTSSYKLLFNASKNYRIPTFNDLYWQGPGAIGNRNLIPETSLQAEIGQEFTIKNFTFNSQLFVIRSNNLILWQPSNQNVWSPNNINQTDHYGTEITASYSHKIGKHTIAGEGRYSYTIAHNTATGNQLAYVPKQQASVVVSHGFKFLSFRLQGRYTDRVYVTSDESQQIDDNFIVDARLQAQLVNKPQHKVNIAFSIQNAFNTNYQTVLSRPNPGRNFLIQTTYIF